jgi:hypothetical protein
LSYDIADRRILQAKLQDPTQIAPGLFLQLTPGNVECKQRTQVVSRCLELHFAATRRNSPIFTIETCNLLARTLQILGVMQNEFSTMLESHNSGNGKL